MANQNVVVVGGFGFGGFILAVLLAMLSYSQYGSYDYAWPTLVYSLLTFIYAFIFGLFIIGGIVLHIFYIYFWADLYAISVGLPPSLLSLGIAIILMILGITFNVINTFRLFQWAYRKQTGQEYVEVTARVPKNALK